MVTPCINDIYCTTNAHNVKKRVHSTHAS